VHASTVFRLGTVAALAGLLLGGCGGSKQSSSTTTNNANNVTAAQTPGVGSGSMSAAQTGSPDMDCGSVKAVWVNTKSRTYHEPGDPYYGHTKHGKYMCPSAARAAGYRPAGGEHAKRSRHSEQAPGVESSPSP
jgi:hypothetical protein